MRAKDNVNIIYLVESPKNYFSCRRYSYILLLPMMAEDNIELPQEDIRIFETMMSLPCLDSLNALCISYRRSLKMHSGVGSASGKIQEDCWLLNNQEHPDPQKVIDNHTNRIPNDFTIYFRNNQILSEWSSPSFSEFLSFQGVQPDLFSPAGILCSSSLMIQGTVKFSHIGMYVCLAYIYIY